MLVWSVFFFPAHNNSTELDHNPVLLLILKLNEFSCVLWRGWGRWTRETIFSSRTPQLLALLFPRRDGARLIPCSPVSLLLHISTCPSLPLMITSPPCTIWFSSPKFLHALQEQLSTCCTWRGPEFSSQQPHGSSQPSVIPAPMDPVFSSGFHGY